MTNTLGYCYRQADRNVFSMRTSVYCRPISVLALFLSVINFLAINTSYCKNNIVRSIRLSILIIWFAMHHVDEPYPTVWALPKLIVLKYQFTINLLHVFCVSVFCAPAILDSAPVPIRSITRLYCERSFSWRPRSVCQNNSSSKPCATNIYFKEAITRNSSLSVPTFL